MDTLLSIADKTVPKSSATPKHVVNPWLDADCEKAIKDRKKAERKFNRQPTAENLTTFQIKRAMARRVIKEKRRQCWRQFVSSINNRTPLSKVWRLIRRLKGKGGRSKWDARERTSHFRIPVRFQTRPVNPRPPCQV